jgi:uncharacterized surface protein with fasciclin (FAS1) repeats
VRDISRAGHLVPATQGHWLRPNTLLMIGGATVIEPDIASSNGVLHGIDKVNIPTKH